MTDYHTRIQAVCVAAGYPFDQAKANFLAWASRDGFHAAMDILIAKETELGIDGGTYEPGLYARHHR